MWTKPKPLLKNGYFNAKTLGCSTASLYACTDYETGKTLYFILQTNINNETKSWYFDSFEKAMMYADLQNLKIDTWGWDTYGIIRCYTVGDRIGIKKKFSDGTTKILEGLDD